MRLFICLFIMQVSFAQTIQDSKLRFDKYMNYKGSISSYVDFKKDQFSIKGPGGEKEFTVYENELPMLRELFMSKSDKELEAFYDQKRNSRLKRRQRDSIWISIEHQRRTENKEVFGKALQGKRIAIDPGHMASNFSEALTEQKFLYFIKDSLIPLDSVKLFEAELTQKTALLLKQMIEEAGGEVMLTRSPEKSCSAFGCTYPFWYSNYKERVLDSLLDLGKIKSPEHKKLSKLDEYPFFWEFFRNHELEQRATLINAYKPDLSIVIHYNVDEKNDPWQTYSDNNYTMCFIGGCYTPNRLSTKQGRIHFLKLLLTDQLDNSEELAAYTIKNFEKNLQIPVACQNDASYLESSCMPTPSHGVYCRQLFLCNAVNSPLVYGESLYQDNKQECMKLMTFDKDYNGIIANERIYQVAYSYFEAILSYYQNKKPDLKVGLK